MTILRSMRITTFGWIVSIGLLIAVATAMTLSLVAVHNAESMDRTWTQFEKTSTQKALLLSQIRGLLGYDGMIHHFKNYVLRKERWRAVAVHKRLLQLSIALTAYQGLGMDEQERKAFSGLLSIADQYKGMVPVAEAMAGKGYSSVEIDNVVKIDDTIGVEALDILDQRLTALHRSYAERVRGAVSAITAFSVGSGAALVGILLVLALVTIWFSHWRLIRPLQNLVSGLGRVNPHDPGTDRLPFTEDINGTELGSLVQASNKFLDAVHAHSVRRQRAEIEVRDREEHLRTIVENAVDAIITIDTNGKILSFNAAASSVFGYPPGEVLGRNVSILMPEPDRSRHDQYLRQYLKTGEAKIIGIGREVKGAREDGSKFPMHLTVSKTKTSEGITFTAIVRDITAEKESELKLRIAKQEAEKANRAKSEFLASMSHELRTPMNAILGFTQLIASSPTDPPTESQKEYLGLVLKSGGQLMELIDLVLNLSEIEAGHMKVDICEVQVMPLIEECLVSLSPRAEAMGVTLGTEGDGYPLPKVQTDPALLRQVLLNLMSNAIKYNMQGGRVAVDAGVTDQDDLRINVHDTGPGISKEKQKDLFVPFNRLGREAGRIEGTGSGLFISKRIMEALGGRISFRSEQEQGSDFWIDLPIAGSESRE